MTNDLINDMDELMNEHALEKAAAEAKAEAERQAADEARQAEWTARQEKDRAARNARDAVLYEKVAAKVAAPHVAIVDAANGKLFIDGIDVTFFIDRKSERTSISRWHSRPTGRMRVVVGDYGSRKSFPQKKDGTHNYEEIALLLTAIANKKNTATKLDAQRRANSAGLRALKAELFPNDPKGYCDVVTPSESPSAPVRFRFAIDHAMSPDRARALAAAIRAAGIKLHYSDKD